MKLKMYRIILVLLIIALLVVIGLIANKYINSFKNEKNNEQTVDTFKEQLTEDTSEGSLENVTMNGYKVIGIVKIPKINIEYPILDLDVPNPEKTVEPMKYSIVKYWGKNVNDFGNLSIAGHNKYDGTMFGKTKELEIGDSIYLIDLTGKTIEYSIFNIFVTDPNDVNILKTEDETIREVTLITCTNGNKNRLIIKAKEI